MAVNPARHAHCRRTWTTPGADGGFGLIEVVVAMTLLLLVILPITYLLASVVKQTSYNRTSVAAGEVAQGILTNAPAQLSLWMNKQWPTAGGPPVIPSGCTAGTLPCTLDQSTTTHAGIQYTSSLALSFSLISAVNQNVCTSGQVPQVVSAVADVTWDHGRSFTEETKIDLPYIPSNINLGYLAVQVNGATGQAQSGVEVSYTSTAPGSATNSVPTDPNGCAFLEIPQGAYNVGVGPPVGSTSTYVSSQEVTAPMEANVSVPAAAITQEQFNYDQSTTATLHYPVVTAVEGGASCPSSQLCLVTGQGSNGATVYLDSPSGWSSLAVAGLARLGPVVCPQSTRCFGVGSTSGASPQATIVNFVDTSGVWSASTTSPPGPSGVTSSALTSIACPLATQCVASGYTITGSATRAGWIVAYNGTNWSRVATSGTTDVPSIACPSTSTCLLVSDNGSTPSLDTFTTSAFTARTLTPVPATLTSVTCPFAAGTSGAPCFAEGTSNGAVTYYVTEDSGTTWVAVSLPSTITTVGEPVCTTTTACVVYGSNDASPGAPVTAIYDLTASTPAPPAASTPLSWSATPATLSSSLASDTVVSAVSCPSATNCVASGQASTGGVPGGLLAQSTDGGVTWSAVPVPAPLAGQQPATFMTGVACSAVGTCVAGATSTGRSILYASTGGVWAESGFDPTAAAGSGVIAEGMSTSVGNSQLTGSGTMVINASTAGSDPTSVGPLYPYPNGYDVWPGSCKAQSISPLPITPATLGGSNTADIQLGYLPLRIVGSTGGQPIPGATVSITELASTGLGCGTDTYSLPISDPAGLSLSGVPLGDYTLTVVDPLDGATTNLTLTIQPGSVTLGTAAAVPLPAILTVPVS